MTQLESPPETMWMFARPLDALAREDLDWLIASKVRETRTLDYKRQMYNDSTDEKRKMLRDVASMANAEGGVLVLGMDEDKGGAASEVLPVPNAGVEADRLIKVCNAFIADRILGLRTRLVDVGGGAVIVVYVPRSYRRPHMVTLDGRTDFWTRHDNGNGPMSVSEVKAAVTATEDLTMKTERFIKARRTHLAAYGFAMMATPLALEEGRVDISDPRLTDLLVNPPAPLLESPAPVRPSLRGRGASSPNETLEVYRSGHVELMLSGCPGGTRGPQHSVLYGRRIASHLVDFTGFLERLREITDISDPYLVTLHLNFRGLDGLAMNSRGLPVIDGSESGWDEGGTVDLGPVLSAQDERPSLAPKRLCDLLWQGFHFESCPYFDEAGRLIGMP